MRHGFQITYINIQHLSIVLIIALLEHFYLEVNEKVSFQSNDSKKHAKFDCIDRYKLHKS